MLLQYLYYLFLKFNIVIFVKCHVCSVRFKYQCCEGRSVYGQILYFIMANASLSFEENSENEANVERQYNNLELLDVTSEKLSFSHLMSCNFENNTFFEDQLQNFPENLCSCHYSDSNPESIESHISTMNLDCTSLISKFGMFEEYLLDLHNKFDIITITEAWFESSTDLSLFQLDGYDMYHLDRGNKKGGGVAIYIQDTLRHSIINHMTHTIDDVLECLLVKFCYLKKCCNVMSLQTSNMYN